MNINDTTPQLQPQLRILVDESKGAGVVAGFDLDAVKDSACNLVLCGFVPVEEEYCLMEHKVTGRQGHYRKITFIKKKFYHE